MMAEDKKILEAPKKVVDGLVEVFEGLAQMFSGVSDQLEKIPLLTAAPEDEIPTLWQRFRHCRKRKVLLHRIPVRSRSRKPTRQMSRQRNRQKFLWQRNLLRRTIRTPEFSFEECDGG